MRTPRGSRTADPSVRGTVPASLAGRGAAPVRERETDTRARTRGTGRRSRVLTANEAGPTGRKGEGRWWGELGSLIFNISNYLSNNPKSLLLPTVKPHPLLRNSEIKKKSKILHF